jgi:hypothetical protein
MNTSFRRFSLHGFFALQGLLLLLFAPLQVHAQDSISLSQEITTLYRSARAVISGNQAQINNPEIGDKNLNRITVLQTAKENYKTATGKDLSMGEPGSVEFKAKTALIESIEEVMDDAQGLINEKGKGFKGFLPAVFARQVAEHFNVRMEQKITLKLTAPKALVRNRANRPDPWESGAIDNLFSKADYEKGKPFYETADAQGKKAFRYILPEYYVESCLGCHGEPKGEIDISGGKKEGAKLGDLGGAISLTIFE